ncbi:MAG: hypothetical protein IPP97_00160 [Candidatus Obscuribacter sp.]|nr:hypothetical protein [Candidatus Obscuribacter sp.]MBP6349529.1 hypothetical protein [Candidatus Obscuribacter sp.]MBP6591953.1 hypothetical protein [Candidatus Obscuribacter sp.]MBP7577367.1 hypothetical protein [Candidatus Obscuribacter sp.]
MNNRFSNKFIAPVFSLFFTAMPTLVLAQDAAKALESYSGYLIDRSCAAQIKMDNMRQHVDPMGAINKHTRHCSLEPSCCEAGYSLYSQGKWFDLDPKGNEMAKKLFEASKKETGQLFKIQGVFKRNELRVSNIAEVAK